MLLQTSVTPVPRNQDSRSASVSGFVFILLLCFEGGQGWFGF